MNTMPGAFASAAFASATEIGRSNSTVIASGWRHAYRHADAGRANPDGLVAEDLFGLVDHLVLFLAVAVGVELPVEGDDVARELRRGGPSVPGLACPQPTPWLRSKSISPLAPLPDDDWYVATTTRFTFARSCSGFSATHRGIATQFGFATIPFLMWCKLLRVHLGHDERAVRVHAPRGRIIDDDRAGLCGDRRKLLADRPRRAGEDDLHARECLGPEQFDLVRFPRELDGFAGAFSEARNLIDLIGKARSASTFRINSPTAPVAPTTATFTDTASPRKLEGKKDSQPHRTGYKKRFQRPRRARWSLGRQAMRIAIGGFMHESNTFAAAADRPAAVREGSLTSAAMIPVWRRRPPRGGRIHRRRDAFGFDLVPDGDGLGHARRAGRGRVVRRVRRGDRRPGAAVAGPTACCWPSTGRWSRRAYPDADGEVLRRLRGALGDDLPIVATLDYHAQRLAGHGRARERPRRLPDLSARRSARRSV